ncbi:MAG: Gfo/Idh/MocA family oxidoreductase [Candidatus Omnitrophota bacterium]
MKEINVAVIGCGYWGPNLVRNFLEQADARLKTVCDLSPERLAYVKRLYPPVVTTTQMQDIFRDKDVQAVVIATPAATHFDIAMNALEAKKHVLIEKPLGLNRQECKKLIAAAKKHELILMVGHTFIYNSAVRKLREYIVQGFIGKTYYIYSQRLNLGKIRQDVNALWNFAPHDISILIYLLNELPHRVRAKGMEFIQKGIADVVMMDLDFPSGVSAHVHVSWLDPNKVRRMTVVGSEKMVVYDDVNADAKIQIFDKGITKKNIAASLGEFKNFGEFQLIHRAGDLVIPKLDNYEPLQEECRHFLQSIRQNSVPLTDGKHGLAVVEILEKAQESMDQGALPVDL